jgi:squalene monooxygenase
VFFLVGRVVLKQATVTKLIEDDNTVKGVEFRSGEGGESTSRVFAPLTIVCDGCFSRLRKSLSSSKVGPRAWGYAVDDDGFLPALI